MLPNGVPASSKVRCEILIMQCLGLVTGLSTPSASAEKAYEALYEAEPIAFNIEALEVLFHCGENESHWQQRKRKPSS